MLCFLEIRGTFVLTKDNTKWTGKLVKSENRKLLEYKILNILNKNHIFKYALQISVFHTVIESNKKSDCSYVVASVVYCIEFVIEMGEYMIFG